MTRAIALILIMTPSLGAYADTFIRYPKTFRVGPSPISIAAADLDGDGIPEILTANRGRLADVRDEHPAGNTVSFLAARNPLEYRALPPLRTGLGPYQIVIANIDALKAPDIVVANFHATRNRDLTLLRNIGENLFEPHHFSISDDLLTYRRMRDSEGHPVFSKPGLTSLIIEDIDQDGYRDAIATGWSADVLLYFPGHPEAYFSGPIITELPGGPRDMATGDFDGDGKADLAVTLYSDNEIALLRGDGTGAFTLVDRFKSRGNLPHKIRWADINKDGKNDLIVSHAHADDSIVVFFGNESFSFPLSQEIILGDSRQKLEFEIRDMVVADLTGNGRVDIALACHEASAVILLKNTSKGTDYPQSFSQEVYRFDGGRPHALCIGDFNQDDHPDLAVALWEADAVALLLGK